MPRVVVVDLIVWRFRHQRFALACHRPRAALAETASYALEEVRS
jgi:hypothetical protein